MAKRPFSLFKTSFLTAFFAFAILPFALKSQCVSGDCKNGKGTFVYPSKAKYTGDFRNGECHGIGVCTISDGSKYSGEWKNRYPEGKGTKTYADGSKRTGLWLKGQPVDASGKIEEKFVAKKKEEKANDGTDIQSGCLAGDCQNGEGTFAYPDGSKYEGQFLGAKPDGKGTFSFANGEKYVGQFHEGYAHGQGAIFKKDGSTRTGEWRNGEFVSAEFVETGRTGCVEGDCADGKGVYIYKEGAAKYTGEFKNSKPDGQGACLYANGDRYNGGWADGAFSGKGTLYLKDGSQVDGWWENGNYLGATEPEEAGELVFEKVEPTKEEQKKVEMAEKARVFAVVVGVSSYNHMPVLRYTDDDAYRFYAFLKSLEGGALPDEQVQVLIDEDASHAAVVAAMNETFSKAGPNDLVLLYFSGHGLKGSFLPHDFDGFNNKLLHEEITAIFEKSQAKFKLCIADACHSGSIFAMRSVDEDETISSYYQTLAKSVSGTALIMSSKGDETSLESSGLRQGVFSHFLIKGLKGEADADADKIISIQELYDYIFTNVRAYTGNRQSPVIKGTYDPAMTIGVVRK